MPSPTPSQNAAFQRLRRALIRRRLMQLDSRMRLELALLGLLLAGFLFWQVRVPLDGLVRAHGPRAALAVLAALWLVLAVAVGGLAAGFHARQLREGPHGPEWLGLPVEPATLAWHLAWEAQSRLWWLAVAAAGVLAAAAGLVPAWWLFGAAGAYVALHLAAGAAGCAVASQVVLQATAPRRGLHPIERVLAVAARRTKRRTLAAALWRPLPAAAAFAGKDLLLTARHGSLQRTVALPIAFGIASVLAWRLPAELPLRHSVAFTMTLLAAVGLAEWLIGLAGSDPFGTLRVLPVGVRMVWGARAVWGVAGALVLVGAHAVAARDLSPGALKVFLLWSCAAVTSIAILGLNYGVTLFPRGDVARRMFGLSLALAMAASIMLPLSGWVVLLTAVLHSARRLPRWSRIEEA